MKPKGKNCLVTGVSAGIGKEFARQLREAGANVIGVSRREGELQADLTSSEDLQRVVEYIQGNQIDLLVNNAGVGSFGRFDELDLAWEEKMIQLNIVATTALAHAVIPQMKERKEGAIISVSSIAAFQPLPYMATYAATKSYNLIHSLGIREELKPFGVKVLTLCPGPTATEFGGVARVPGTLTGIYRDRVEVVVRNTLKRVSRKAVVIPTLRAWLIALPSKLLPKTITTRQVGKVLGEVLPE